MDSDNYNYEKNLLSLDRRRSPLVLIPKGAKYIKRELKTWYPISLLNVDYKILAKVHANILQVLARIKSPHQAGYMKGRYIGDNIRTLLDILNITENKTESGIKVIDFEKAFDTISWSFLHKTLDYFNFGPTFKKYIKLLYTSPVCSVKIMV